MSIFFPPPPQIVAGNTGQPYAPPNLNPFFEAVTVDSPITGYPQWLIGMMEVVYAAQPDPFQYGMELGAAQGLQPYGQRKLWADRLSVAVSIVPTVGTALATMMEVVQLAQPDPWQYALLAPGPYGQRKLWADRLSVPANNPPFADPSRAVSQMAVTYTLAQPDPWVYAFIGDNAPYSPNHLAPSGVAVTVNNPPFDRRAVNNYLTIRGTWDIPFDLQVIPDRLEIGAPVSRTKRNKVYVIT